MNRFTDQLNRIIELKCPPRRIVSLVPSQTELLVDLGLREQIVGVTKFCVHPQDLRKEKKVVGGTKQVHYDEIRQLEPDIILCNKEENTKEMVEELEKIAPVHVSEIYNIDSAVDLIFRYGELFEVEKAAGKITADLLQGLDDFLIFIENRPKKRVAYFIWKKPWMAAGENTFIDYLLEINNLQNVFRDTGERYPVVEPDLLKEKGVDIVLLSTEPFPFKKKHKKDLQEKIGEVQIEIVDGEFFSWYGSRLIPAFKYFKEFHRSLLDS